MDINKEILHPDDNYANLHSKIKDRLAGNVSEELYNAWVNHMVIENIDEGEILVAYYGEEPIKRSNKETLWLYVSTVVGYRDKFKIVKKKFGEETLKPEETVTKEEVKKTVKEETEKKSKAGKKKIRMAKLLLMSLFFVAVSFVIILFMFNYIDNQNFRETFYSASSLKIDNKIRIVQISDLHSCSYGKDNKELTDRIKKLNPDIILLTGDIIDATNLDEEEAVSLCQKIAKIAPSYYVYGNNEVEVIYDFKLNKNALDKEFGFNDENRDEAKLLDVPDEFEQEIEKTGVKVLKNETDTITVGKTHVDIYGVLTSNPSSFWPYGGKSFSKYIHENPGHLKVTAIHEPFIFEELETETWGDIMVCGHTHGGVMRLPVIGPLYTREGGILPERGDSFVYGRYDAAGKPLIVSSGLANNTIMRINNQPELVVIDINKF